MSKFFIKTLSFLGFKTQGYFSPCNRDDENGQWTISNYEITHDSLLFIKIALFLFTLAGYKAEQIERNSIFISL